MQSRAEQTNAAALMGLLRLMRPANIITAHADILAGFAAASQKDVSALPLLLLATTGLYGGGVVLNDVFDAELDGIERPERSIPRGVVSKNGAAIFGSALLMAGIWSAWQWSVLSGAVAACVALAAVTYDRFGKHQPVFGPINMGLCRALNLMLGVTAGSRIEPLHWLLALVPLCYIAGITSLSRGEVKGGTRTAATISLMWMIAALVVFTTAAVLAGPSAVWCLPFVAGLLFRVGKPLRLAYRSFTPGAIRIAVKSGILSLILLNAGVAALYVGPQYCMAVLLLYIPATLLARYFAVT